MEFIPLAEETGLIDRIGEWMMRRSVPAASAWQRRVSRTPPLKMSMNISGKQFSRSDLAEVLHAILR